MSYSTLWEALSSIMAVIATIMTTFALVYPVRTYKRTMQVVHYGEIDRMYFDILKEAMVEKLRDFSFEQIKELMNSLK